MSRELEAGIPLTENLAHAAAADVAAAHRRSFEKARERAAQGESLAASLREYGRRLPASFLHFVDLGESSGQLPEALRQVAEMYAPIIAARRQIARTVLLCSAVLCVGGIVFLVVETAFLLTTGILNGAFLAL
jgi:type II secretory pathway component PulF